MKPMRATSDLHLSESTADYVFAALEQLKADAQAHGGPTVIVGDVFNEPTQVHMPTWNRLRHMLQNWPDTVWVIAGNHDQFGDGWTPENQFTLDHATGWRNCLEGLAGGACKVISRPMWAGLGRMLPYCKPDRFVEMLAECKNPPIGGRPFLPIVWTHHGFKGAYRNAMSRDRDGVDCSEIPTRHLVVSGHYHMPQTLGRIVYCGSPYETSFAEEGQRKGWLRWEDAEANPLPLRHPFDGLGAPRHYTIEWDPAMGPPDVPPGIVDRDIVRVRAKTSRKKAVEAAAQLKKVGLEGAPVLALAERERAVVDTTGDPRTVTMRWVIAMHNDPEKPAMDPGEMEEWAEDVGLWEGS